MQLKTPSPSGFIYQRNQDPSTPLSTQDKPDMEPPKPNMFTACHQHPPWARTHTRTEAIDSEATHTSRRATVPNNISPHHTQFGTSQPQICAVRCGDNSACHYPAGAPNSYPTRYSTEVRPRHYHSDPTHYSSSNVDSQHATSPTSNVPPQANFPIPTIEDLTSSIDSEATLVPESRAISVETDRIDHICNAVRTVYDICLQSTKTYLDAHLTNRRARASIPSLESTSGHNYSYDGLNNKSNGHNTSIHSGSNLHINLTTPNTNAHAHNTISPRNDIRPVIPPSTNSLLKNISSICGILWTGSQRDRLDVLNVERMTVDTMGRLLAWAETVALSDYDEWQTADSGAEDAFRRVLDAGRNLCSWLNVPDGIQEMEVLLFEVGSDEDLGEGEGGRPEVRYRG